VLSAVQDLAGPHVWLAPALLLTFATPHQADAFEATVGTLRQKLAQAHKLAREKVGSSRLPRLLTPA
jgi:hypothetical protein